MSLNPSGSAQAAALDRPSAFALPRVRLGLLGVCLLAALVASHGLTNESAVSLHGDMPKYLMNGVYVLDAARDRPFDSVETLRDYTRLYFARYPALSLGHHPPLLPVLEAPVFAVFGVSVMSARLIGLLAFVAAAGLLYLLVSERFGWMVAVLTSALFITSPVIVDLSRSVLSETPTLALVMASAYCLHRFCLTERRLPLIGFVVAAALSLYAKQLAIFVFPAYLAAAVAALGVRRLLRRDVLLASAAVVVATLPLVPMTLMLSPTNVTATVMAWQTGGRSVSGVLERALTAQFAWPVLVLIAAGTLRAVVRRDRRSILFLAWAASSLLGLAVVGRWEPARYGVYAVPALAFLAASLATGWRTGRQRLAAAILVAAALGVQAGQASGRTLPGAGGYEEAAQFVVASEPGATVLFSGDVDTGYFTFFVRKHDVDRSLVVLRADKVLTTSFMGNPSLYERIGEQSEIYDALRTFGTRYVVIEDRPSRSRVLEWVRSEVRSSRFAERRRIPIGTTDHRLQGADLVVYEFLDAGPPDPAAVLSMDLPIIGRSVAVHLSDLLDRKYLR